MKSLELNWIRKKVDKSIPLPEVIFFPLTDDKVGSYYCPTPNNEIYDIEGKSYSLKYGAIVVSSRYDNKVQRNIIAHEWRHHWQYYHGIKFEIPKCNVTQITKDNYNDMAKLYFTTSKTELDALRFSYVHAGFLSNYEPWEELFYDLIKDLRVIKPIITYGKDKYYEQRNKI